MINKNLKFLYSALALLVLAASGVKAQDFELNSMNAADIKAAQTDKGIFDFINPGKPEETQTQKEWTVMVFMNAKNNLSDSQLMGLVGKWAEKDIAEMKKVGSNDKINIIVEHGIKGKGARRLLITKKGSVLSSGEKVYGEYPNADMGDYKRVVEFAKWGKTTFPAKHYMLVLWNHGLGWIDPKMEQAPSGTGTTKGILFDDETKNYVRTAQMGEMMKQIGYVDILMQNACLQQMAEVLYEMKDYTGLFVGSEETMLAQGFDYEKLLNFMNANTAFTNEQLSDWLMNWYKEFYAAGMNVGPVTMPLDKMGATLSTVRPAALGELPAYLNGLANAAIRNGETEAAKAAVGGVIRFTSLDPANDKKKMIAAYADLYDFARIMGQNAKSDETRLAAEALMGFIKTRLVLRSVGLNGDAENGYNYTTVGGIAISTTMKIKTVPAQLANLYETKYSDLSLSKDSQWNEFLDWTDEVWRK